MSEPVKAAEEEERETNYNEICQRFLEFIQQQESSVLSSSSLSFHQSAAVGDNLATRSVTCGEDYTALVCEEEQDSVCCFFNLFAAASLLCI